MERTAWDVDGVRLCGDALGPASGPPVLLLHGGGQTRGSWAATARALAAAGFRATTVDARGHGESDRARGGTYALDDFIADAEAVVASFATPPALVGASMGGIVGLLVAARARVPIAALVVVDIAHRNEAEGVARVVGFMHEHRDGFASLDDAANAVATYLSHRARPADPEGLRRNLRQGEDGRWYWHWDPALLASFDLAPLRDEAMLRSAARATTVPLLVVRGGESDLVTGDAAAELAELAPQGRLVTVEAAGHTVPGDANDAFTSAVIAFLDDVYAARRRPGT